MVKSSPQLMNEGSSSFLRAARAGNLEKVLEYLNGSLDINTSNMNGMNALHLASKEGHSEMVKELLKRGANVNAGTNKGNTALHIASLGGKLEVVEILVENGANVNAQSLNGFTPLYMAAQENHDTVVRYLLSHGANQSLATEDGFTPLAVALQQGHDKVVTILLENDTKGKVRLPALHIAAKKDDCKAAALLLQSDQKPDVTSKSGFTPLHIAAHYGNENIGTLLLDKGANINFTAKHKITPLHVAAKWGKAHMVQLLLDRGAQIDAATRDGLTPLHCAARSGHEPVVDLLLKRGAPYSAKTKNGLAPLHMASQGDHIDSARTLLAYKAPVDDVTVDFLTPLHVAAHCGHVKVAKLLLDHKANVNARALNGFVPLHIACKKNRIKVVELLLKHGASIEVTTESGLTPLHVASFMGCINIVIYLIQNGADVDGATVRGETPIHLAARASQSEIIKILLRNGALVDKTAREDQTALHIASRLNNTEIVQLLLARGASVDVATKDQYTALHIAAKEGHREVAAYLLEQGASLTATTKKGFTPLHLAAKYGKITVAGLLLEKEAPVDAQGKNGVTPLHVAAHYDHVNVALLLLEKKASPHATAKNGYTPLHIAAKKKQIEIATTLLEYGADTNAESKAGFTPLHLAAQEGHTDMGELLISHKANVNAKSKLELTPLHLAAQGDRVAVAQVLLKKRANVNAQTKQGYTPLHVACHNGAVGMIKLLLQAGANVDITTQHGYTPLHQAAQQGHTLVINLLLDHKASPNKTTNLGYTPLAIAQKCNYISVVETLKTVTEVTTTSIITTTTGEKYSYNNPETMQETFMTTDSEDEGGEGADNWEKANLNYEKGDGGEYNKHDESFGFDVTHDESISRAGDLSAHAPLIADESISPSHIIMQESMINNFTPDNIDISRPPTSVGRLKWKTFLVSFMVDARGGAMRGCRHSGVRIIIPPRKAPMPMRITCRYLRREKLIHPPPLMEGEACASRILEVGPSGAKFLGPVIIEVPHFASMRGKEREIIILRSDDGESWREHTLEASEEAVREILNDSFQGESDLNNLEPEFASDRITRILTTDFPQYFAIITRIRQEVHAIGPEGGMVNSTVVPQVQAIFPEGALTKKIKVGLQAQPISSELVAKMLGNRVAVSPIVTVEPRRRKFHKPITLTIPVPQAATRGMINNYTGDTPTLRLLCSITGGTSKAQWEDVTGSTPLTFVNQCVSFTTTVSARFWLMDCRQINEATKFATDLYREATAVPFMSKFVVFSKRHDPAEAQMRIFCMTDDKEEKTLEHQEQFTEVAKSRDVEVLEGKSQYLEFAGNLVPVTKSGEQLNLTFQAFRENRLPFLIRVRDSSQEPFGKIAFMKEPRKTRGEAPQVPICNLNIKLPETIVEDEPMVINNHHQQFTDVHYIKSETIQRSALDDHDIILNADPSLMQMGQELGKDWIKVASHLDLDSIDSEKIKKQFPNRESEQATALLNTVNRKSSIWTNKQLCKILWDIGRKDLVTKFYPEYKRHLAEFGIKLNGKLDERSETIESSKSLPTEREVTLDDKDIMKDAESMDDSEGESGNLLGQSTVTATTTNNKIPSHEVKGREDEERASAVQQYLKYLEDEDREDSEERAAFRGEKTNSNELYIIKEEIQVPSGDSSSIKSTNQISITSPEPTHEAESHIKTEEKVEFSDDGGLTHSITQVTKTTIIQDVEEPVQVQQHFQKQQSQPQEAQTKQQESAYSNEADTISQVSISSIPEDDKSDPTSANISSATTTTTNASDVRISSVTEEPGTKITVEQNGNSVNHEEYNMIAETILRQVYDEVFELIRTKKIAIDDKEWFETEASGDVVHIIEQSTTCERTNDKSDLIADENDHEMSYTEKKDYFTKLSNDSKVKPVPPASHYCRSSSIETSGMGKDDRRPSEGEIVETVGAFQDRRAYFEATGGRRSYSIDIANMDEARTAYSTSLVQRSTATKTTTVAIVPGLTEQFEEEEEERINSNDARQVNQICTSQLTTTFETISESLIDNVDSKSNENRLSSAIEPEAVDGLNGSLSPREPDSNLDYNQDHVSTLAKSSPPEVVDATTMEQVISPVIDFPDYLTTEVQVKVGVSPTEEVEVTPTETNKRVDVMTKSQKGDKLESESTDVADDVLIETVGSMAFDNGAFEGADAIDAREELDDGAVSPFEIIRDETDDKPSTRPSMGSPITDSEANDDEVMRQLESERIEYRDNGNDQNGAFNAYDHNESKNKQMIDLSGDDKDSKDSLNEFDANDVDAVFLTSTDLLQQENKLSADCDDKSSTIVHGSSRLHSASEIEENVVVWETTIHQHSIEIQDEVSEMTSNGMKVRLEERINEEIEKSESSDSTSLKKEARELANQIVGQVKETIQSQPLLKVIESVEISDEDLVELSDGQSTGDEVKQLKDELSSEKKQLNQHEEFKLIQDLESSEKFRIEKHETSEIVVDTNGQEYLVTETRTTEERTRSETLIKQDEIPTDAEPVVKMRVKASRNQSEDDFGGSGSGKEQRFSIDSDRLANLSATGASLSSSPTSSDRKFVSCLSQSPGSSRPTSSEFDHLVPGFGHGHGGSYTGPSGSEYETAATSQASSSYISANQAATSGESTSYVTAKSSRESTISVDSDHSFNYTDSETSETLMTGNFVHDGQTPVPQPDRSSSGKSIKANVDENEDDEEDEDEDEDEDESSTPVNYDLTSSQVKEPYESEIPEDVIRSGIEIPFMSSSCNWELIEKPESQSNSSSPFEIIPISSEQITELMEETPEKMLGEKVSAVPGLPTESTETSTSVATATTTTITTIKSGTSQGSGNDDNDQPSISDGSATWLSSSLGTAVGIGNNSFDSSTGGQMSDRVGGGPVSGFTDSINSFDALGHSSDNLGTGDAMSSLESQGHSLTTNLNNQIVTAITTPTTMTTTLVTSSSPEMLALISGSDAVEISDFERYDIDRSSFGDFSPGLRLPEHGHDNLGGSLSSVNDINEIPSEAAANDTPLISQSSVASSILSEQARHQLSYDLSPEIPCQGAGGETLTMRSDDTQLFSEEDGTRPQSPIPPNDFGSNVVSSIGMYDTWEEKSPCSDDTDMCMIMTPSVNDVNMPPPPTSFLPPSSSLSSGNGLSLTGNPIEGITELGRIEEEEDEFGFLVNSSKIVSNVNNIVTSSEDYRPMTLGFDRSKPIPVSSIVTGHITTVTEGSHEGSSTGSSLQEFEKLEAEVTSLKVGPGNRPIHHGSSDSIGSFGSIGGKPLHGKGSQGDDNLSVNSLVEFEKLESECRDAEVIESAARDEAARLSEIEEGHESQASDSQETLSDQGNSDEEDADYEKRMKEIDEMIGVTKPIKPNETKNN